MFTCAYQISQFGRSDDAVMMVVMVTVPVRSLYVNGEKGEDAHITDHTQSARPATAKQRK